MQVLFLGHLGPASLTALLLVGVFCLGIGDTTFAVSVLPARHQRLDSLPQLVGHDPRWLLTFPHTPMINDQELSGMTSDHFVRNS